MQQLEGRNTYTPTDIPHVRGNCGFALNREETLSVQSLKTSSNTSDAALIATEHARQDLRVPAVYVLNMRGEPLMPTTPRKTRYALTVGKKMKGKREVVIPLVTSTILSRLLCCYGAEQVLVFVGLQQLVTETITETTEVAEQSSVKY